MNSIIPWIRSVVAFPLGLVALQLFHLGASQLVPQAYGQLDSDSGRWLVLTLATAAGILGSFVVGATARHRIWLHMLIFLALMLVIDLVALKGSLAAQPLWFKTLILATLPLQVWIGARLAALTLPRRSGVDSN